MVEYLTCQLPVDIPKKSRRVEYLRPRRKPCSRRGRSGRPRSLSSKDRRFGIRRGSDESSGIAILTLIRIAMAQAIPIFPTPTIDTLTRCG